jgi:hypothetical protein
MTVLDDMLARAMAPELGLLGLELVGPRRWVGESNNAIRRMFEFQPLKGMQYVACWGFSLDFVPKFRNDGFRWKRTAKAAQLDLRIRPIDEWGGVEPCSLSYFAPIEIPSWPEVMHVVAVTSRKAREDYARVESVRDIAGLFEERAKRMRARGIITDIFIQTELAWGLAQIAIGRKEEGDRHLKLFCERLKVERDDPFLRKAELAAEAYAEKANESRPSSL